MISIIVCSVNDFLFKNLYYSISKNIGDDVIWEIVKIDNKISNYSLSKAYNIGALKAKFDILVFVHEDVVFHTIDWGNLLIHNFNVLDNPGILGVAGSDYQSFFPCDWWSPIAENRFYNYIQSDISNPNYLVHEISSKCCFQKVICLDGVFLAVKKSVFLKVLFDEEIKGFHGYDISICVRMSQNYNNYFINNILIEHFSKGNRNLEYINNLLVIQKRNKRYLPIFVNGKVDFFIEFKTYVQFFEFLFSISYISFFRKIFLGFYFIVISFFKFYNIKFALKLSKYYFFRVKSEI